MEFSVSILLALVVYIEYIRGAVPVWPTADDAAIIVWLFIGYPFEPIRRNRLEKVDIVF